MLFMVVQLYPLNSNGYKVLCPFPPPPSPWQPPFYSLLLWVWLFEIPHIIGILQCLSFCVWLISLSIMSSRFIQVVAYGGISFFFRLNNIPLCVYTTFKNPFIHQWTLRLFPYLGYSEQGCDVGGGHIKGNQAADGSPPQSYLRCHVTCWTRI